LRGTAFALAVLIAGLGVAPAHGHGEEEHGMPAVSPSEDTTTHELGHGELGEPGEPGEPGERRICSFRAGLHQPAICGTEKTLRPAPPLRGTMLMFEANSFTGLEPTASQQQAADEMVAACQASVAKHGWDDLANATASGFVQAWNDPIHYVNRDFVFDDVFLDCDKPEYLMYYDTPSGKTLAGVMFVTQNLLDEGPQFGGPTTRWHYHYWSTPRCMRGGVLAIGTAALGECEEGEVSFRSPEMLHVWLFDHSAGRFSAMMHLSDEMVDELIRQTGEEPAP
jgi:hypothetical protein